MFSNPNEVLDQIKAELLEVDPKHLKAVHQYVLYVKAKRSWKTAIAQTLDLLRFAAPRLFRMRKAYPMYQGYSESPEQIAARKARILKGYKPPKRKKTGGRKPSSFRGAK